MDKKMIDNYAYVESCDNCTYYQNNKMYIKYCNNCKHNHFLDNNFKPKQLESKTTTNAKEEVYINGDKI